MEIRLRGIAVSPGIVVGNAYVRRPEEVVVPNFVVDSEKVDAEIARFHAGLEQTQAEILEGQKRLAAQMGEDHAKIFDAHLLILQDTKAIEDTEKFIRDKLMCAEFAFNRVIGRILESFDSIADPYLKERSTDIQDVRRRLNEVELEYNRLSAAIKEKQSSGIPPSEAEFQKLYELHQEKGRLGQQVEQTEDTEMQSL